ncbi:MAG: hypothetical protein HC877_07310 [Thioploca sp.]|nr:hypothetical protein [Thioploca sp.]
MRVLKILFLIVTILPPFAYSNEVKRIKEIRTLFSEWQPIVKSEIKNAPSVYRYVWGDRYENEEWTTQEVKSNLKLLAEKNSVIRNELGSFVLREIYSFSGDWSVVSENYYDKNGKLFFVFWTMNTFQAEEPVTVEKRLYFDKKGEMVRSVQDVYKLNTKQQLKVSFIDHEVLYEVDFKSLPYSGYLPRYP